MADAENTTSKPVSPLGHLAVFRHSKDSVDGSQVKLSVKTDAAIAQVFAKNGQTDQLASLLNISTQPGQASTQDQQTALPLSPGQWLLVSPKGAEGQWCEELSQRLEGVGYVSEQSHGRVVFRVSGPRARQVMQKGCRLDLHPRQAQPGFCAQTSMAQIGVIIHQVDDEPGYDIYVYSGFADSFWHWLNHAAAEYLTHS